MSLYTDDTVCAIASASGGALRGIIRVSGRDAVPIAARLFESSDDQRFDRLRRATALPGRVCIELNATPRLLPCDLFLWPTTRSYTREPIAELHTIGSPPILESLLAAVCQAGARLAEPGEFTMRAFLAGRLDLTQAEAVLGVIDAHGDAELDTALAQLAGGLAQPLQQLREELLQLLAELEAGLDFVEEDIEFVSSSELLARIRSTDTLLQNVAAQMRSRHIASDLPQIALVGRPNVGKSSLFNAAVKRFGCATSNFSGQHIPALVSPQRGTTRDYLVASISLGGHAVEIVDTAGMDCMPSSYIGDRAQAITVDRRKLAAVRAYCVEAATVVADDSTADLYGLDGAMDCDLIVLTKSDLLPHVPSPVDSRCKLSVVITSSRTTEGLDDFCTVIQDLLTDNTARTTRHAVAGTADRCRESIRLAAQSLQAAADILTNNGGNELVAAELRAALAELGKVVGAVYTDDLLDRIFSKFCIGK